MTDIREGMWEVSVLAEVGGQPLPLPPVVRHCITTQSVQDLMAQMGGAGATRYPTSADRKPRALEHRVLGRDRDR
jgi:hypothetical protein